MNSSNTALNRLSLIVAMAAVVLGALPVAAQPTYTIRDLGILPGGYVSGGAGLNNFGRACGYSFTATGDIHGFLNDGMMLEIAPLPGARQAYAMALNDAGDLVAASYNLGASVTHGFLWQAGVATDLGAITPRGINASDVIVGYVALDDPAFGWVDHAARWQAGVITDLGTLGGHFSYAYAVSDAGQIVGMSFTTNDNNRRAVLYQGGVWHDLGTLGGSNSHAYDINDAGAVVGVADTAANAPHAFLYTVDAGGNVLSRTDLGVLAGGYSYAYAVNNAGEVVGTSGAKAFRWKLGLMQDLNTLVPPQANWRLESAWCVNERGQIVGSGYHIGQPRAYLMTPKRPGDMNCDGVVDMLDVPALVQALIDPAGYMASYADCDITNGDLNVDTAVNGADIQGFVTVLFGP